MYIKNHDLMQQKRAPFIQKNVAKLFLESKLYFFEAELSGSYKLLSRFSLQVLACQASKKANATTVGFPLQSGLDWRLKFSVNL